MNVELEDAVKVINELQSDNSRLRLSNSVLARELDKQAREATRLGGLLADKQKEEKPKAKKGKAKKE